MNSSTHPLAPPQEDSLISRLRLIRSHRVGAITYHRLMGEHGSARAALEALPNIARGAGVSRYTPWPEDLACRELAQGRKLGATPLAHGLPGYPADLADLPDAPPFLWALGRQALLSRPLVAIVGARNASSLGIRMARRLAHDLGEAGVVAVSGLARGVDRAVHLGALDYGTIGVQAGGLDVIYPAENADLHETLAREGLRLSEHPPGLAPVARNFPQRNRIIAGLSRAVVVVEAAAKSGSLLTARMAADYGREVMAVPGHPFDARTTGCNHLIRDGATLIQGAADVLEALGPFRPTKFESRQPPPPRAPGATRPTPGRSPCRF
ncbi:DNA-processing protein DprA [Rhodovulum imhoffii]|uniref:DNA-processing protein DprA n=1 Tax=Rhodovulum imhoffii TaxID=365340 RepID=UPI0019114C6C|nr:DNA-processing protein DprA [Rhodovulum imhoffii]MBK5934992.1 DNA protecting protein DprA [Rhodovulum imhoffii]